MENICSTFLILKVKSYLLTTKVARLVLFLSPVKPLILLWSGCVLYRIVLIFEKCGRFGAISRDIYGNGIIR